MIRLFFVFILSGFLFAQSIHTDEDLRICKQKFELADSLDLSDKPINQVIIEIAKSFVGIEYVANTLQNENEEKLKIHLTGLDCYTFLEASLVFARTVKAGKSDFTDFENELEKIRYRNGKLKDYTSRLHYFSDWLYEMDKRGIIVDITEKVGGERYDKVINFMSSNPKFYKELKGNSLFVDKMKKIEEDINKRKYFYVEQFNIEEIESELQDGDLIGITSDISGLDISHVGLAIKMNNGRVHFLHAPLAGKKIQITKMPLSEYVKNNKKQTGIMIGRALELKN